MNFDDEAAAGAGAAAFPDFPHFMNLTRNQEAEGAIIRFTNG